MWLQGTARLAVRWPLRMKPFGLLFLRTIKDLDKDSAQARR